MPGFSLRRRRSKKGAVPPVPPNTPLPLLPDSPRPPTPPPKPSGLTNAPVRRVQAELVWIKEQWETIESLLEKMQVAIKDRTHPLSIETGRLRAFNAGKTSGNLHFLRGPPPSPCDLGLVIYIDDNRTPTMHAFLKALGDELDEPLPPGLNEIEGIVHARQDLCRKRGEALAQLEKLNASIERQVQGNRRERVRTIRRMTLMLQDFREANSELLDEQHLPSATTQHLKSEVVSKQDITHIHLKKYDI